MGRQSIKNRRHAAVLIALVVAAGSGAGATAGGYHALHASGTPQHAKPPVHSSPRHPDRSDMVRRHERCLPTEQGDACLLDPDLSRATAPADR